jgi:hypothetical protein
MRLGVIYALGSMLIILDVLADDALNAAQPESIPAARVCSHSGPPFVGPCRTVHGGLALGGDNIYVRIYVEGTGRILGYADGALRCTLPQDLENILMKEQYVEADVVVRPVTVSKPGFMQFVCISSVKNIKIEGQK